MRAVCDLNFIVKGEGFLKVIDSHVHWKSGNISETVLDRDVVTSLKLNFYRRNLLVYWTKAHQTATECSQIIGITNFAPKLLVAMATSLERL